VGSSGGVGGEAVGQGVPDGQDRATDRGRGALKEAQENGILRRADVVGFAQIRSYLPGALRLANGGDLGGGVESLQRCRAGLGAL